MYLTTALFILGLVLLLRGAHYLVDGASSLARRLGVPAIVVGLTIVSFGTSLPELVVNVFASIQGRTDIAIGNVIGSNIANILLILGVSVLISPLAVKKDTTWKEIPFSLLAVVVAGIMASDQLLDGQNFSGLGKSDGLVLLGFFIIFFYYIYGLTKSAPAEASVEIKTHSAGLSAIMILGGLGALVLGGKWIVDAAVTFARSLGVSEALIGLTIVAVGTSLPELATSAVAAYKKNADIAIGNVVGSNIFNIFFVLGASSIINPLPFAKFLLFDLAVVIVATFLLFLFMFLGRRHHLERWQGLMFLLFYISYLTYLINRG